MSRTVLLAVVLDLVALPALACSSLPLYVAPDIARPPELALVGSFSFPHLRTALTPNELYRVGDLAGLDDVRLRVVKGPGPDEVILWADPACETVTTFADGKTPRRELHVATTGSAGGDGSPGNPFDTLERAAGAAIPGDRIVIHEGSYPGSSYITSLQGTADDPIWVSGAAGEARPVLGSSAVAEAIHLSDPAWVVLERLVVDGPTGNGINIDDGGDYSTPAHHVLIREVEIRNVGTGGNQDCLKLSGLDDFYVFASSIHDGSAGGSGIDMVGCHRGLIEGNSFRNMGSNAIQAKGGSSELTIRANLMVDCGFRAMNLGGSTGLQYFRPPGALYEARDLRALSNIVVGSDAPVAYVGCDGCLAANNTLYLPQVWVIRILQETTEPGFVECRDGRFLNNIVVFDSAVLRTHVNIGPNTQPDTFVFANNLWFSRDDPGFGGPSLPTPETDAIIQQDPLLSDPTSEDFRLLSGSPAEDAGLCFDGLVDDFDGLCYGDPPTLGAHEMP